jgi:hypothetical protein
MPCAALGLALGLALLPCAARSQSQSLAAIPVEAAPAAAGTGASGVSGTATAPGDATPLRVRVHTADAPGLARLLGLAAVPGAGSTSLELSLMPGAHPALDASADPLAASFIVDFEDPAVVALRQRMLGQQGPAQAGGAEVVAFVAKTVQSHYAANAHLASEVARTLQGDCTEHALLTAALARSLQIPARLVQGAALVYAEGQWQAYGHAWVQMYEAGRWTVRDSALANWPGPVYYLPALVIGNEGPGYRLDMLLGFGRMPSRLQVLGPAGAVAAP